MIRIAHSKAIAMCYNMFALMQQKYSHYIFKLKCRMDDFLNVNQLQFQKKTFKTNHLQKKL